MSSTSTVADDSIAAKLRRVLVQTDGQLTRELVRSPSKFGLGQLPVARTPDAVTEMVCGFCSTGCGLNIHLKDSQAVGL